MRLHEQPDMDARIVGHLRAGDVAQIVRIGTSTYLTQDETAMWIELADSSQIGWTISTYLELHTSQTRAAHAAANAEANANGGGDDIR